LDFKVCFEIFFIITVCRFFFYLGGIYIVFIKDHFKKCGRDENQTWVPAVPAKSYYAGEERFVSTVEVHFEGPVSPYRICPGVVRVNRHWFRQAMLDF
jgi:hypothetical protein